MIKLKLTKGHGWSYEFQASSGSDIEQGATAAFRKHDADHAEAIMAFQHWLNSAKRDYQAWYQSKVDEGHPDLPSMAGIRDQWIGNAERGYRFGKQQMIPVRKIGYLYLLVENPAIPGEWCPVLPHSGPGHQPLIITRKLQIDPAKKAPNFDVLYETCQETANYIENMAGLAEHAVSMRGTPKLKIVRG